jgi:uncharacterized protein YggE
MRKARIITLTTLTLASGFMVPAPILAQSNAEPAFVETSGSGLVVLDFDQFSLQVQARGTGDTRAAALASASARADNLRNVMARIRGVTGFKVVGTQPSITPVGPGCDGYNQTRCTPTSHQANIAITIAAKPATAAAAALVVLEEQGFSVGTPSYSREDITQAALTSRRLAFDNAKASADLIASTAGCRRGKLMTIVMRNDPAARDGEQVIVVTGTSTNGGAMLSPSFNLQLEAGKANIVAEVFTKFQLICGG